jgi:protein PhnA
MDTEKILQQRSESKCELCNATQDLTVYEVPPTSNGSADECVLLCGNCREQIEDPGKMDIHHWRCLNESMWSQIPAVQVMVWRVLTRLGTESEFQNLLDMLYLDEETLAWAQATGEGESQGKSLKYLDCNNTELNAGDSVTIIKDLNVKGANFTAKRGTLVRKINLDPDNHEQIEGRVNGQQIVIFTRFLKKVK